MAARCSSLPELVTRSRQDQEAVHLLEAKTTRGDVEGIQGYATPLLRVNSVLQLHAHKEAVLAILHGTERRLLGDPQRAEAEQLEKAGHAVRSNNQ